MSFDAGRSTPDFVTIAQSSADAPRARLALHRRGALTLLLGALVSGIALFVLAREANVALTLSALASSNPLWVALAFAAQVAATLFNVRRWQILLRPYPTRFWKLTEIFYIAHLLNTILPAKLGTVARIALGAESEKLNAGFVLGSVAIEKVADTLVMLFLLIALTPFAPLPMWLRDSLIASVSLVLLGILGLAGVGRFRAAVLDALTRIETQPLGRAAPRVAAFVRGILESIVNLTRLRELAPFLIWTALVWLTGALVNQLLLAAVGIQVPWSTAWFVMVILQFGARVPVLPANLGVFHYLVVLALGVFGVNANSALAYAILLHLVIFVLPALIGAACALPTSAHLIALVMDGLRRTEANTRHAAQ